MGWSRTSPGGGGGGNPLQVYERSDNNQPAVFATFADLETYTATPAGTTDAAAINVNNIDQARFAFVVGTITNNVLDAESVYVRVNGAWVLAINDLVGLPGEKLLKRVIVNSASDLTGMLDSTKEYFIDGIIDMAGQSIAVPAGGLTLSGYNFDVSKLVSASDGYTMFISPTGGSGNVLGKDYAIEVTGTGSQVYDLKSSAGTQAFEVARINYNNCSSLGVIDNYRQGLEVGTGRIGGTPDLTLAGEWLGGYFIDTSIVRSLEDGAYSLFKAGTDFTMASRFRSNMNLDLPASAALLDFSPFNFLNPSTLQMEGIIVTRNGVFDATDTNITPNISETDLVCSWTGNNGLPNTFEGGSVGVSTESVTTIAVAGEFVDLVAGDWTASNLQHFDSPQGGLLRNLGNSPREYKVIADFNIEGNPNDDLTLRVTKWDNSASSFVTVLEQSRQVNNLSGGRDVAFFNVNINTTLNKDDYIKLQITNVTNNSDVLAETGSYYIVEQR